MSISNQEAEQIAFTAFAVKEIVAFYVRNPTILLKHIDDMGRGVKFSDAHTVILSNAKMMGDMILHSYVKDIQ